MTTEHDAALAAIRERQHRHAQVRRRFREDLERAAEQGPLSDADARLIESILGRAVTHGEGGDAA